MRPLCLRARALHLVVAAACAAALGCTKTVPVDLTVLEPVDRGIELLELEQAVGSPHRSEG